MGISYIEMNEQKIPIEDEELRERVEVMQGTIDECVRTLGYTKSYNLLPCNKVGGEWNGIKTTPVFNDDNSLAYYSVSGTRTSETYYMIYSGNKLPKGVEVGKTYKVSANSTNALIKIQIYEIINGIYTQTAFTDKEVEWSPSANSTNIEIRISVDSSASGLSDVRIYPMIRPSDIEDSTYKPYVEDVQTHIDNNSLDTSTLIQRVNLTNNMSTSVAIENYNNYNGLYLNIFADSNSGNPLFIPKALFNTQIRFTVNASNQFGTSFVFQVQGYVNKGVLTIHLCKLTGWTQGFIDVYGLK